MHHCKRVITVCAQVLTQRQLISGSRSENEGKVRTLALFSLPAKKMCQLGHTPFKAIVNIANRQRYGARDSLVVTSSSIFHSPRRYKIVNFAKKIVNLGTHRVWAIFGIAGLTPEEARLI